ncbi:MAG: conjugative transposon protein TraN, partial [Bacteroidales bacterium]|nr:conjugative transposon protein TraN [Bacteroidales bacterium]
MKTKLLIAILALGWLCPEIALAQAPDTLFISTTQVVHIRFGSELKYVNLGNKAIVAKIVDGSKDYVAVKAREPFDICTSMSCLESTGAMHTFLVAYREYPQRLDVDTRIPVRPAGTAGPSEARPSAPADTSFSFSAHSFQTISEMPKELYHIGAK